MYIYIYTYIIIKQWNHKDRWRGTGAAAAGTAQSSVDLRAGGRDWVNHQGLENTHRPSSKLTVCCWQWPISSWFTYEKHGGFQWSYVSLPEGIIKSRSTLPSRPQWAWVLSTQNHCLFPNKLNLWQLWGYPLGMENPPFVDDVPMKTTWGTEEFPAGHVWNLHGFEPSKRLRQYPGCLVVSLSDAERCGGWG